MGNPTGAAKPQNRVIPFGKYLLLERIAVGGMAEVFLSKSFGIEGFEKIIAIKRILPTMAEDDDFIEMFIDEAKIAGQLSHANIVPIYELGKIGDSHYIAMEYVWGKDLLQIMNRFRRMRKRMPPAMVAFIASKMCEALEYAHTKRDRRGAPLNLIHRDISPQNILVSYDGAVKLIDFGIAKAASRTTKTQAGVLKGKFGYMSPEQVRGLPIDLRSDIFAVGTCMYEMLTADRLFVGESDFSTLEKVRHAAVAPPSEMVPDVPKDFDSIVMKALAREPADRWQTAGEMQEALQEFIATQRPPFTTSKMAAWMRSAFTKEQEEEKARLDSYASVGRPSVLGSPPNSLGSTTPGRVTQRPPKPPPPAPRPAAPAPAAPAPMDDDFGGDEMVGESTMISASPFEALQDELDELDASPTQIFFSSDDDAPGASHDLPPATRPSPGGPSPSVQVFGAPGGARPMPAPIAVGTPAAPPRPVTGPMGHPPRPMSPPTGPMPAMGGPMPGGPMQGGPMQGGPMPGGPMQGGPMQGQPPGTARPVVGGGSPSVQVGDDRPTLAFESAPPPGPGFAAPGFAPPPPGPGFAPPPGGDGQQRHLATMEMPRVDPDAVPRKGKGATIAAAVIGGLLLVGLGIGGALWFVNRTPPVGSLEVRTVPDVGAEVRIDGTPKGRAPLRVDDVPAGRHTLELVADGYQPVSRPIDVGEGTTAMLDIVLISAGVASAPTTPTEATPVPTTPTEAVPTPTEATPTPTEATPTEVAAVIPTPTEMAPTPVEVAPTMAVEPPRMTETIARVDPPTMTATTMTEPTTMIVRVEREPTETMASEMAAPRGRGTLVVNSLPWSEVYVDGRRRGNTPIPSLQLPAGEHRIELRTADGRTHRETVTIEPNTTARVVHRF
jgi:serine/threonine protein kinase